MSKKEIIAIKESLYLIKHTEFHKTFASIFLTYTDIYNENSLINKMTRWV